MGEAHFGEHRGPSGSGACIPARREPDENLGRPLGHWTGTRCRADPNQPRHRVGYGPVRRSRRSDRSRLERREGRPACTTADNRGSLNHARTPHQDPQPHPGPASPKTRNTRQIRVRLSCSLPTCGSWTGSDCMWRGRGTVQLRLGTVLSPSSYSTALPTRGSILDQWWKIKRAVYDAVVDDGGAITYDHAVGRDHQPWYERRRSRCWATWGPPVRRHTWARRKSGFPQPRSSRRVTRPAR